MQGTVTVVKYYGKINSDKVQNELKRMYDKGWRLVSVVHHPENTDLLLFWESVD